MEKFILIGCHEREIYVEGVFDTLEAAQKAMKAAFRTYHIEEQKMSEEDFEESTECDECCIDEMSAWYNVDDNIDWAIREINLDVSTNRSFSTIYSITLHQNDVDVRAFTFEVAGYSSIEAAKSDFDNQIDRCMRIANIKEGSLLIDITICDPNGDYCEGETEIEYDYPKTEITKE